jgi:hypothetical protein
MTCPVCEKLNELQLVRDYILAKGYFSRGAIETIDLLRLIIDTVHTKTFTDEEKVSMIQEFIVGSTHTKPLLIQQHRETLQ